MKRMIPFLLLSAPLGILGCAAENDVGWLAGTRGWLTAAQGLKVPAWVPADQQHKLQGRTTIKLPRGTAVIIVGDSLPPWPDGIRVTRVVVEGGEYAGIELFVTLNSFEVPPEPLPPLYVNRWLLVTVGIFGAAWAAASLSLWARKRRKERCLWAARASGNPYPKRGRSSHQKKPAPLPDDPERWLEWLRTRNALSSASTRQENFRVLIGQRNP